MAWLALALLLVSVVSMTVLASRSHSGESPSLARFRLVLPRGAHFPVANAAAWFASLAPLLDSSRSLPQVELRGEGRELVVAIAVPAAWEEAVRGQLAAWFPEARLEPDGADADRRSDVAMRMERPDIHPIRVPDEGEPDPLLGVIGVLTQDARPSGVCIEWGPAPREWKRWSKAALGAVQAGRNPPPRGWLFWPFALLEMLRPAKSDTSGGVRSSGPDVEAVSAKVRDAVFNTRVTSWASDGARATRIAEQLRIGFRHPFGNALIHTKKKHVLTALFGRRSGRVMALTARELGALFHVPESEHPLVRCEPSRQKSAPSRVRNGGSSGDGFVRLGEALTGEQPVPFGLCSEDRRFHNYVVGKTGTGKSTLLATILKQDLESGRGVGLIDPHGDLAEQVLALVPPERYGELLYFNPADAAWPVGFNILAAASPEVRPLVASGLVGVFKKLYGDSWGPRLEYFLRNAVLTLLEAPAPSLLALPRLLVDRPFRERILAHVRDPLLRSFFLEEYPRYDPRWRSEAISPILNKVGQFLSSPLVRHVVGQSEPGFNLREVMDRGGIFIANLSSGRIGEDSAGLLGGLLVAAFQLAALSRANRPEAERRDFFLAIDEFQHFANEAFAGILSEARKYRLALTLSHQYLDQLPPGISDAVFGNAGSLCVFRVGAQDTTRLERELAPVFDTQDLVHLPNHRFCARINRGGETVPAFSARTVPLTRPTRDVSPLIEASRARWARPRAEVELEIADLWEARS